MIPAVLEGEWSVGRRGSEGFLRRATVVVGSVTIPADVPESAFAHQEELAHSISGRGGKGVPEATLISISTDGIQEILADRTSWVVI